MKSGLLWYDGSKKPIGSKIEDAARRYKEKYGYLPDTCFVHPTDFDKGIKINFRAEVKPKKTILKNHIWLGINK